MEENQQKSEPTEQEIKEYEEKMTFHYQKNLPFLRLKAEFDGLQADISEARIRILQANHAWYQANTPPKEDKKDPDPNKTGG